jgi:hypothetical protein
MTEFKDTMRKIRRRAPIVTFTTGLLALAAAVAVNGLIAVQLIGR